MRRQRLIAIVSALLVTVAFMPDSMFDGGISPALAKSGNGNGGGKGAGNGNGGGRGNGNANGGSKSDGKSGNGGAKGNGGSNPGSGSSGTSSSGSTNSSGKASKAKASPGAPGQRARASSATASSKARTSRSAAASERAHTAKARATEVIQKSAGLPRSRNRILAKGLDGPTLRRLAGRGFVVQRQTLSETNIVELQVPPGRSLVDGMSAVLALRPQASLATNDYYYPAGHSGARDDGTLENLIAWPASGQSCYARPVIGMVDTAVDPASPAVYGRDVEIITTGDSPSDNVHGTAVASILLGNESAHVEGLVPSAKLISVDAFSRDDSGDRSDAMSLIKAIELLTERRVDVINLSLAGPPNEFLEQAIQRTIDRGIPVVAAVGNDGPGASPKYPAAYPSVVAVTATDQDLAVYRSANRGDYVDFAAPTMTTKDAHFYGTSFAAPVVSAALAILKHGQPSLSPVEAEARLEKTAIDLGKPGKDGVYGWGLLQADGICGLSPNEDSIPATVSR